MTQLDRAHAAQVISDDDGSISGMLDAVSAALEASKFLRGGIQATSCGQSPHGALLVGRHTICSRRGMRVSFVSGRHDRKDISRGYGALSAEVYLCGHRLSAEVSRPQGSNLIIVQSRQRIRPFRTHVVYETSSYTCHHTPNIKHVEMNGSLRSIRLETPTTGMRALSCHER